MSQTTLFLRNSTNATQAVLKVRYYNKTGLIEADVTTQGIDYSDGVGKDLIVNFKFDDFEANKTFYTDSNGLEMQERVLNHRNMWNFSTIQNISANYYPVDTAIAMKDKRRNVGVTVMNDRSQGGSAELIKGNIELIHSRRMIHDDDRGVGEPLDELEDLNDNSRGIIVNAVYTIDIYNITKNASKQRLVQLATDQPPQLYFAMNYTQKNITVEKRELTNLLSQENLPFLKVITFPLAHNSILIRIENIYDVFDGEYPVYHVDVMRVALNFFERVNSKLSARPFIEIVETDITNNMSVEEAEKVRASKKWKAEDDEEIALKLSQDPKLRDIYEGPKDDVSRGTYAGVALQPQRIRTFRITYSYP